jgi:hypothetical protein
MTRTLLCSLLVLALGLAPALPAAAQGTVTDPEILRGMKQVDEGDYDAGILTLDAAVRRLSGQPARQGELAQAYLYLGVAYLGKGHETSARARFRDALKQARDLNLSPERFAPRVIELFEKAKEVVGPGATTAPPPSAAPAAAAPVPSAKKGGSKLPLVLVGVGAVAAGGIALAAGGGGGESNDPSRPGTGGGNLRETAFPNEVVVFGGGRDFVVNVNGSGTLTAKVNWQQPGVLLSMYIVALSNAPRVLADGNQTATGEVTLTLPVTAQAYRISVTNSSGSGPRVDTTFTLRVQHP